MNGADLLCDTLLSNGVDICFANPGTSEMHFVAALDRKPRMRCVLGLFEGVVTAAADGYARMADKPAATLLHLGPGLANGLANLHNARRAHTPMVNIVGDHATYHLKHDAPLTSDIDSLARPMSCWVGRATEAKEVRVRTEEAYLAALTHPGVATLILHADAAWGGYEGEAPTPVAIPAQPKVEAVKIREAAALLRSGGKSAIILGGRAMRAAALEVAGKIAAGTGATLLTQRAARWERGAGRVTPAAVPYPVDHAVRALKEFDSVVLIGGTAPVAFFAYPGKPGTLLPEGCKVLELAGQEHDLPLALAMLADELDVGGLRPSGIQPYTAPDLPGPSGELTPDAIAVAMARVLPEGAIVCDEGITSTRRFSELAATAAPHDHLPITGGAIGIGIPLATGAAVACPDRKVIGLQADGSGMYTLQALWTQARENLDVVTIVYSNRGYAILKGEMRNVGVNDFGRNARRMLEIENPALDWCSLAKGMGVEAARAETAESFTRLFETALSRKGPFLIEAVV